MLKLSRHEFELVFCTLKIKKSKYFQFELVQKKKEKKKGEYLQHQWLCIISPLRLQQPFYKDSPLHLLNEYSESWEF